MSGDFATEDATATLVKAARLVPHLERSANARREYADLLRSLISANDAEPADAIDQLFRLDGDDLLNRLDGAAFDDLSDLPPISSGGGSVQAIPQRGAGQDDFGETAGLPFGLDKLWSKGRNLLNLVTYYEMKARAGAIGGTALAPVLSEHVTGRTRLHLVGHSFGARLVTAAAMALPNHEHADSLSLLQAAFSHNSFARQWQPGNDGHFRAVVEAGKVSGPILITHTRNDKAVGIAYALASRIAGQNDAFIGDRKSIYGGLGSNGAQHTPEALDDQALGDIQTTYQLSEGKVYNLLADQFISGHGDVAGVQVANAVLQAVRAGR